MPSQAEEPEYPPSLAIRRAKMSLLLLSAFVSALPCYIESMTDIGLYCQSFLLYVVWKVIYTLYNRHFHPLRHYPGPFLATISRLPYARAYILGQLHTYVSSLHELYGDVVRVAPDELSFRTEQAWNDIYSFPTDFPKDPRFFNVGKSGASNLGVAPTKEVHRRQRRVLGGAFSDMALKHQEPLLQGYVDILIKTMYNKARAESKIDVVEWYNYTTFDFMAEYVYGESLSCLKDARCHPFIGMKFVSVKAWTIISMSKYLPSLSYLIKAVAWYLHGDLFRNRETNAQFNKSKIAERMSSDRDSSKKDYITHVRSSQGPKGSLSEDEIHANASFLMIAGSETTATTLSGCTFLLLARPDAYQELTCQIRLRYQNSSDITFASMTDFPYLDAVLQEALRMYPATPLGMPRIVPEGGAMISGTFVPGKVRAQNT